MARLSTLPFTVYTHIRRNLVHLHMCKLRLWPIQSRRTRSQRKTYSSIAGALWHASLAHIISSSIKNEFSLNASAVLMGDGLGRVCVCVGAEFNIIINIILCVYLSFALRCCFAVSSASSCSPVAIDDLPLVRFRFLHIQTNRFVL